jgi:hypothetical protein
MSRLPSIDVGSALRCAIRCRMVDVGVAKVFFFVFLGEGLGCPCTGGCGGLEERIILGAV